jgi:hypothetical protein
MFYIKSNISKQYRTTKVACKQKLAAFGKLVNKHTFAEILDGVLCENWHRNYSPKTTIITSKIFIKCFGH